MNNIQRKGIGKMKIYKKVIACILTLMMFFAQMPVNVFAANQKNNIPLDIVLVLDVSGSMEDPITSTDTTKRITILKDSINQFIEEFAKNNSKQSDEKYQSRISIIKFSGKIPDNANKIGNDTYQENRNTYNYTQIMSDFFTATNDNKAKLEDVVNSISPAGATRSDFAMELALKQINQSKNDESRKDAKRIVFFVTDGQPTTLNNFDDDVANGAINTSKEIKKDAEVYTFGMFSETDPSITGHVGSGSWSGKEMFNAYMHGVSSNYSDAQSYKNLGTRAENSAYYMGAKSSKEATAIFDSVIAKLLSMTYAGADYTDVDAAIKRANSLNKDNYKDFSKVEDAINAVNRDKDITEQEVVNGYAKAINEAIDHLEYKDADYTKVTEAIEKANNLNKDNYKDFTEVEKAINAVVTGKNITQQDEVDAIGALVFQLKIKYNSNGGTGTMANPAIELDKEFTFPKCEYVAPNGKHFKGWQVDNTVYKVGDKRVFTKDDQNKEIKAVWEEHTFDQKLKEVNGVSTLKDKATCTTNAIYYKSCTCGQVSTTETFEDKDTKLGHEYTKQIKDEKYLKSQGSNCQEHDAYWYVCSRCDASAKDDENAQDKYYESAEVGNHVYDQEVESSEYLATPATCMTPARYYKSCICGAKGTEAFAATGTHLGHAYIEVKNPQFLREKATNCKEHDTYWYVCSRCGKTSKTINKYYEDKDSKGEHISSDWIIDQQPTVAKEGSKHKECTVCKEVLETEKIAKLENVKTETKKEETASKKETKVESKKAVTTGDNTNSIVPMALLGISLLGIYMIVMKKYVR